MQEGTPVGKGQAAHKAGRRSQDRQAGRQSQDRQAGRQAGRQAIGSPQQAQQHTLQTSAG